MARMSVFDMIIRAGDGAITRLSNRIITKDCNRINPSLHMFLLDVIRRNNNELCLPINNPSSLENRGYTIHNNAVRYRFELIAPKKPPYNKLDFKNILQGYCNQTAAGFGVYGLNISYNGVCSVFVDSIFWDNSVMTIDLIYIDNDNALKCYKEALIRDKTMMKNEPAVRKLLKLLSLNRFQN